MRPGVKGRNLARNVKGKGGRMDGTELGATKWMVSMMMQMIQIATIS